MRDSVFRSSLTTGPSSIENFRIGKKQGNDHILVMKVQENGDSENKILPTNTKEEDLEDTWNKTHNVHLNMVLKTPLHEFMVKKLTTNKFDSPLSCTISYTKTNEEITLTFPTLQTLLNDFKRSEGEYIQVHDNYTITDAFSLSRESISKSPYFAHHIQIHTVAGLIYPCIFTPRIGEPEDRGSDPYAKRLAEISLEEYDSTSTYQTPQKNKDTALCTIILGKDRIDVPKLNDMTNGVDLHVFTSASSSNFKGLNDTVQVHHINRLKLVDEMVLYSDQTDKQTFLDFLKTVMSDENFGLYDFIDTLKVVLLFILLECDYEYVAYQDFTNVLPVNDIINSVQIQTMVDRFGILYGAGYDPEVHFLFVSKAAKNATQITVQRLLDIDQRSFMPWGQTGTMKNTRPKHFLRLRSIITVRLIRTLFHTGEEDPEPWFKTLMWLDVNEETSCSLMLVNSIEDITFAMKVLSMRCLPNWMLQTWKPTTKTPDDLDLAYLYNYTHNVLLRQWFLWKEGLIPPNAKVWNIDLSTHEKFEAMQVD